VEPDEIVRREAGCQNGQIIRVLGGADNLEGVARRSSVCSPLVISSATMPTKDETVRTLASWHFRVEPDLSRVVRIVSANEDAPDEPIKLLEVNAATVATGTVEAFGFTPTSTVPFPTLIAEVTPEEYTRIERHEISLPEGWSLTNAQQFRRPEAA